MRKFAIEPAKDTGQPTICNTLRRLHRRTTDPVSLELIADCYDYAKRMDVKLRDYRTAFTSIPKAMRAELGLMQGDTNGPV
jgi:hypothetical protein